MLILHINASFAQDTDIDDLLKDINFSSKKNDKPDSPAAADNNILKLITEKTRPALSSAKQEDAAITKKVNAATWLLLTGEYLFKSNDKTTLWSNSISALHEGKEMLDKLEKEIESNVEKQKELFKDHNLAIKYDLARARRNEIENKEKLARNDELDRLHQLRELINTYIELTKIMTKADEYRLLGDLSKSQNSLAKIGRASCRERV
jgi:hypothetical protein